MEENFSILLRIIKPTYLYNFPTNLIDTCLFLFYEYDGEFKKIKILNRPSYDYEILEETDETIILKVNDYGDFKYFKVVKKTGNFGDVTDIIDKNKYKENKLASEFIGGIKWQGY